MNEVEWAALLIRVIVGATMMSFGVHQIVRPGAWSGYLPPQLIRLLPAPKNSFMRTHGLGNLALGLGLFIQLLPFVVDWIVLVWWLSILPFAFYADWAVGMRDASVIAALAALIIMGHP